MSTTEPVEPQYLLARQIQIDALAIEQNLGHLYNPEASPELKKVAVAYLYGQTRHIKDLADQLFQQYRTIEKEMEKRPPWLNKPQRES